MAGLLEKSDAAAAYERLYFHSTPWLPVYTLLCVAGSLPCLLVTIPLGLGVADDAVFGAVVMFGGPLGDSIFRGAFKKVMYLIGDVQAIWTWPAIGLLVMIFQPLG